MVAEFKNIEVRYDDKILFKDLSFDIEKGQKVVITGASGKGKTTVLNVLTGFTPFHTGDINVLGKSLSPENIQWIRQQISWVPQETALHFDSVKEMIYAPFEFASNTHLKPTKEQIELLFEALSLPFEILNKTPATISGGQRQRVLLASSLLLQKPILITDEPTSALDENNRKRITDYVLGQKDLTVIASTHDTYWMEKSDKIIAL
jgi:ABC-type bacteriocin/lantibiotic exporter with double-glycine peptidase domain